ncbi:MAG: helicase-exonuclease AddAB subunit AddA [Eubacteriales bacterium]|nr:helicase-exonuclease AddAB subunit AddA [Eubacteriales bacterium]
MEMKWTEDQEKVISLRDRNILVSAAAGSGKTAVLVQRILERIMDKSDPVNIDELLIMTFTRAAAGEMKERISKALEKAVREHPEDEHLQRQLTVLHAAQITTIDGFCGYIIRNYFHMIDLDPGYRVGDEGEMKLLCQDVLAEVLESCYAENDPDFVYFVECFAPGKTDEALKDYIMQVYSAAMSDPFPEQWLEQCLDAYQIDEEEHLGNLPWMKLLWTEAENLILEAKNILHKAINLCNESSGPYFYRDALQDDEENVRVLEKLLTNADYNEITGYIQQHEFTKLSRKRDENVDDVLKSRVKDLRDDYKKIIDELKKDYFCETEESILEDINESRKALEVLVNLTRKFIKAFAEKKREKNLIDFTDMEHFALQILWEYKDGKWVRTQAAHELSLRFREVMVDEYQDSNLVQERLTVAVSGHGTEDKNIFMVGDVKQSIYRFRQARPDLFMEKYDSYETKDSENQRIDLRKNFRSRSEVLRSVNYIFRQIMERDIGGVSYDDDAALYPEDSFPEGQRKEFAHTEVMLIEKDSEELEDEQGIQNAIDMEALAIAQRIQELIKKEQIYDGKLKKYRKVEYGDIAVLLRTSAKWAERFSQIFTSKGIPSYTASKSGYFSTTEIETVLNYLKVCDNPYQDIPLFGVLYSPIVGLSSEELAEVRAEYKQRCLYETICAFLEDGQMEVIENKTKAECKQKLERFLKQLKEFRKAAVYTPVHQFILQILEQTGYGNYVKAMPAGEQRKMNLIMLVEKAMAYEKTSYRGLFNFVRYIEQLQKYEVDYGEVNLSAEENGAVQIMTIHKSKGLEFPIVFAAGMGKGFNQMDIRAKLLIHPQIGLACNAVYPDKRVEVPTLIKQILRKQLKIDALGEELRVLYVAFTRAKEKLIISGTMGKVDKKIEALQHLRELDTEVLPYQMRQSAKSYWDYVLPALYRHAGMNKLMIQFGVLDGAIPLPHDEGAEFDVHFITARDLVLEEIENATDQILRKDELKNWDPDRIYDEKLRAQLQERFEYQYPFVNLRKIPAKASISELKKGEFENKEEFGYENPYLVYKKQKKKKEVIPKFINDRQEEVKGAARGTAYHRVMECLDYERIRTDEMLQEQIADMVQTNKMSREEADVVKTSDIRLFLNSEIGKRMEKAALAGLLKREQPFVFQVPASRLNSQWDQNVSVLIQGIIDAYFIENNEIVILDYKTDRIDREDKLVEHYHKQLEGYADALTQLTGMPVKQKYIYSFTIKKDILL